MITEDPAIDGVNGQEERTEKQRRSKEWREMGKRENL